MELSVSNDFLSLFIPESSEFTSDDIIQEFKIFLFRMMNITVDSLKQEQINNEYEKQVSKNNNKELFSDRITNILEINELHKIIHEKMNIVKSITSNNLSLIEQNTISFNEKIINEQFGTITEDIKLNKEILNNSTGLIDLLSIPQRMIECFSHNTIDLYLEYRDYINGILSTNKIVIEIRSKAKVVNDLICALIKKLIQVDYRFTISKANIYDILSLIRHSIFTDNDELNAKEYIKSLSVLFFQIECYLKQSHSIHDQLLFFTEKIAQTIHDSKSKNNAIINDINKKFCSKIMEEYLINIFKQLYLHNQDSFKQTKEVIETFMFQTQILNVITNENVTEFDQMEKDFFFQFLSQMLMKNIEALNNFLLMTKDVKKLFASTIDSLSLKYEVVVIIYNNLYAIYNQIAEEKYWRLKDKKTLLDTVYSHCQDIMEMIRVFFDDNLFQFKLTTEMEKEFNSFKDILLYKVIAQFMSDVCVVLGLSQAFELKKKTELIDLFNQEFSIQRLY